MPDAPTRRWLSPRAAAIYIGVSYRTILSWTVDGTLPRGIVARIRRRESRGVGRHICTLRIDKIALDRFLEGRAG